MLPQRTGLVVADLIVIGAVVLQGVSFGINPNTAAAINSLAILGVAVITAWTASKAAAIKKVADATHILTNSAMGAQLLANVQNLQAMAVLAHRFAENNNASDIAAAAAIDVRVEEARAKYQEHVKRQAVVDALDPK